MFIETIPLAWTPFMLVAVVGMGMAIAFVSADYRSPTSRAIGIALAAISLSVGFSLPSMGEAGSMPDWWRWLALSDGVAIMAILEWVRRVRRTIDAEHLHFGVTEILLRLAQLSTFVYIGAGIYAPQLRRDEFLGAFENAWVMLQPGFWLFAGPMLFSCFAGGTVTLFLLLGRPDRSERIRIWAMILTVPLLIAGMVLPLSWSALVMMVGLMIFLIGTVHYLVLQGQRGQFLARFLSPQVDRLVRERGLRHAVQHRQMEITVVCCDLRGFTAFAQAHPSSTVIQTLREYYNVVGCVVANYGGTIKDYAGDGILILVGAPLEIKAHARCGLEMARGIRLDAGQMTRRWSSNAYPLGIGIGVASGTVTVGIIGSASRWEYTAVGSTVNLASRLCEAAAADQILIDEQCARLAGDYGLQTEKLRSVKGFSDPIQTYQVPI